MKNSTIVTGLALLVLVSSVAVLFSKVDGFKVTKKAAPKMAAPKKVASKMVASKMT
jgi:hypothetical protein